MTSVDEFLNGPEHKEIPRNGRGQYLMADESGAVGPRTRATTFADTLANPFGLHEWQKRIVAKGIASRPELVALAASTPTDDKKTFATIVEAALEQGGGNAASRAGTALHQTTAAITSGAMRMEDVPPHILPDVQAYFREIDRLGIVEVPRFIERAVYNATYNVGGTFDRVYRLPDGSQVIGDIKTGSNLSYGEHEFAVQLALYANADLMFEPGSAENAQTMPDVRRDFALILHVPAGRGEAFAERIDIARGWYAARICSEAREWRASKHLRTPYLPGGSSPVWIQTPVSPIVFGEIDRATMAEHGAALIASAAAKVQEKPVPDPEVPAVATLEDAPIDKAVPFDPAVEGAALYESLGESKKAAQELAAKVDPSIKLNQWGVRICRDIVASPNWAAYKEAQETQAPLEVVVETVVEEAPAEPERVIESAQIFDKLMAAKIANAIVEPVHDESFYLDQIRHCRTKQALAGLWQHAADNGVVWSDTLNNAGMAQLSNLG